MEEIVSSDRENFKSSRSELSTSGALILEKAFVGRRPMLG